MTVASNMRLSIVTAIVTGLRLWAVFQLVKVAAAWASDKQTHGEVIGDESPNKSEDDIDLIDGKGGAYSLPPNPWIEPDQPGAAFSQPPLSTFPKQSQALSHDTLHHWNHAHFSANRLSYRPNHPPALPPLLHAPSPPIFQQIQPPFPHLVSDEVNQFFQPQPQQTSGLRQWQYGTWNQRQQQQNFQQQYLLPSPQQYYLQQQYPLQQDPRQLQYPQQNPYQISSPITWTGGQPQDQIHQKYYQVHQHFSKPPKPPSKVAYNPSHSGPSRLHQYGSQSSQDPEDFFKLYADPELTNLKAQGLMDQLDRLIEAVRPIERPLPGDLRFQLLQQAAKILSRIASLSVVLISQRDNSVMDTRVDDLLHKMEDKSYQLKTMLIEMASLASSGEEVATPPKNLPFQQPVGAWNPAKGMVWPAGREMDDTADDDESVPNPLTPAALWAI